MLKISAVYLIGKAEIPIHYTTWAPVEQALLSFYLSHSGSKWLKPTEVLSKFQQIDEIFVSGHYMPFIKKNIWKGCRHKNNHVNITN
jgi:hypothetical protein